MAAKPNTHVFTIDYRGFGHSTGSPTEAGLIIDGVALVDWILTVAGVPPDRIVILGMSTNLSPGDASPADSVAPGHAGQSLGTAVSSAVALQFADPKNSLVPAESAKRHQLMSLTPNTHPITFAGIILAAPFNSVPTLLLTYRIGGLLPLLLPLRPFPYIADVLLSQMVDNWRTSERLAAYYDVLRASQSLYSGGRSMGSLQVLHALNDADIPYHQTEMICRRMLGERGSSSDLDSNEIDGKRCVDGSQGATVLHVSLADRPRLRFELLKHGGKYRCRELSLPSTDMSRAQ